MDLIDKAVKDVMDAGDWLEAEMKKKGIGEEEIDTRCHLFGQLFAIMMMSGNPVPPMKVAEDYLAKM